jgi:NAD-dependent SIR2 family protein deacetylase
MARTINDLIDHMHKFEDAVVIIGPRALDALNLEHPTKEEIENNFTKKALRRDPEAFWKFFKDKIFVDPSNHFPTETQCAVSTLQQLGVVKTIIDLNSDGLLKFHTGPSIKDYIQLHGSNLVFKCQKCKTIFSYHALMDDNFNINNTCCEACGGALRPTTLVTGENYDDDAFHAVKEALFNTHTLILVGVNYGEEPIVDLIAKFGDMKAMASSENDTRMLVAVTEPDLELDLNELTFFEFLVKDNMDEAMSRLLKTFRS